MVKIAKNGQNRQKWSKSPKMVKNGQKWFQMVQNDSTWFKMVKNDQNCQKWSKSPKMVKIVKNGKDGLKSYKIVPNELKWSKRV